MERVVALKVGDKYRSKAIGILDAYKSMGKIGYLGKRKFFLTTFLVSGEEKYLNEITRKISKLKGKK